MTSTSLVNELKGVYDAMFGLGGHRIWKTIGVTSWSVRGRSVTCAGKGATDQ